MALDYSGVYNAAEAPGPAPALAAVPIYRLPVAGEAVAVATSLYQWAKAGADTGAWLMRTAAGGFLDAVLNRANIWLTAQAFNAGWSTTGAPTKWVLVATLDGGGITGKLRLYAGVGGATGHYAIVANASYNDGGDLWTADAGGASSWRVKVSLDRVDLERKALGAAPWADATWVSITVLASDTSTAGLVRGATGLYATTGPVRAEAGNVDAQGDPASDQARVKGKQFVMAGTAPTIAKGAGLIGVGVDGAVAMVAGSVDSHGSFTATSGAAPTNGVIVTVTFNKAYPSAPTVLISPTNAATTDLGWEPYVATTTNGFTISSTLTNPLGAGVPYGWSYLVIG